MRRCSALHGAGGAPVVWRHIGAGGTICIPGVPEKHIETPGSTLIGPCVTGGKLGPATSKGAVVWLAACVPEINWPHSGTVDTISMVRA